MAITFIFNVAVIAGLSEDPDQTGPQVQTEISKSVDSDQNARL